VSKRLLVVGEAMPDGSQMCSLGEPMECPECHRAALLVVHRPGAATLCLPCDGKREREAKAKSDPLGVNRLEAIIMGRK